MLLQKDKKKTEDNNVSQLFFYLFILFSISDFFIYFLVVPVAS